MQVREKWRYISATSKVRPPPCSPSAQQRHSHPVIDHIITLQQSLAHYERMLGHSHPAYLAHLRFQLSEAKGGMDKALVSLTIIGVVVLAMQGVLQTVGMNIHVPRSGQNLIVFGIMLAISVLVGGTVLALSRFWWVRSKGGRGRMRAI